VFVRALLLGAALAASPGLIAAAPALDADRAAVRHAVDADGASGCSAAELAAITRTAQITSLGTLAGRRVILAAVQGSCICGNVNCPYYVVREDPGARSDVLLTSYAYELAPIGKAQPLPNLRELAHDSALVSDETLYAFRDGTYVSTASARVRADNGTRKANELPVHFAPGASSAVLNGTVSPGWYDEFALVAARGQRITVAGPPGLSFALTHRASGTSIQLTSGVPAALARSGTYLLHVDTTGDGDRAYRATVSIR
jgi:hypothetical protein